MSPVPVELRGTRVLLRQWQAADLEAFAEMNADARVMAHFPALLTHEQSAQMMRRLHDGIAERGWGDWALDIDGACAGFVGLPRPSQTPATST